MTAVLVRREAAARLLVPDSVAWGRAATAPADYLLVHASSDIARQCELLGRAPGRGEVRVALTPSSRAGRWALDVVARDRAGLLAAFTGVLAGEGIEVVQAVIATWDDGAALQAFVVEAASPPDADRLRELFGQSLATLRRAVAVEGATVAFDNGTLSAYTACVVRAPDQPGLLHAIAVAVADAGCDVHAASVATADGMAIDRFDLSAAGGRKLSEAEQSLIAGRLQA